MSGRLLALGDVHGGLRALEQVLERAHFDAGSDRLIFLGDVCDGWPEVVECIKLLRSLGAESVWGNHDVWAWEWMQTGRIQQAWYTQGGRATYESMGKSAVQAMHSFAGYFGGLRDYIHDAERHYLFVHGGIPRDGRIGGLPGREFLTWDRDLFMAAAQMHVAGAADGPLTHFAKVFIGHTTTEQFSDVPVTAGGVVLLDQGGGWSGKLSLMDADTGEFWQSDVVQDLYPEHPGRRAA